MRELAQRDFHEFVMQAWHVLEPGTPFVDGIHVRAICMHLQAITEARLENLIINVPPGHAKSLLTAVFWPAWWWIHAPEIRFLFAAYSASLSVRDSVRCRRLIESDWYQQRWRTRYQLTGDQNQKHRFENTRTGYRIATSVGGSATGERADVVVVDDPHSVAQAASDVERRSAVEWWNGTMSTRLNDFSTGHKVVIQQRLHETDVTGDLLQKGGYELLCLAAEYEPERRCTTSIGWSDPRREPGELLWPEMVTRQHLEAQKVSLGSYGYAGQYQQRPSPADGGIFKRWWFRFWRPAHLDLPPIQLRTADGEVVTIYAVPIPAEFDTMIQSWDTAFKCLATSDYVVGQVWGAKSADRFLLDQRRDRLDMPGTKEAIKQMSERWPRAAAKLVEDKANGPAVIQELRHDVSGLIEVTPEGGKVARAHGVAPQLEAGNIYLPHPAMAPWVEAFLEEVVAFPNARNDDQVDAMTQALHRLRGHGGGFWVPESKIIMNPLPPSPVWKRAYAMAVTPNGVAALWGSRDEGGTIYLYAEHQFPHAEPSENARAIKEAGNWIPGIIAGAKAQNQRIGQIYRELGLKIQGSFNAEKTGMYEVWQLLATNKLKVFASISGFLAEYRVGDERSPLLLCCRALIAYRQLMTTKPKPAPIPSPVSGGDRSWMW